MGSRVGKTVTIDEEGAPYEAVCEFRCTHRVVPITRRAITIVEEKLVHDYFAEGYRGPAAPSVTAYRAVDAEGTEWTKDWEGSYSDGYSGSIWVAAGGRRASTAVAAAPSVPSGERGYAFTDLTGGVPPISRIGQ